MMPECCAGGRPPLSEGLAHHFHAVEKQAHSPEKADEVNDCIVHRNLVGLVCHVGGRSFGKINENSPTSKIFIAWAAFKTKETELCMRQLEIIVAVGNDGAIGREGSLIWRIPADLRRFKKMTMAIRSS